MLNLLMLPISHVRRLATGHNVMSIESLRGPLNCVICPTGCRRRCNCMREIISDDEEVSAKLWAWLSGFDKSERTDPTGPSPYLEIALGFTRTYFVVFGIPRPESRGNSIALNERGFAVLKDRATTFSRALPCLFLGKILLLSGCGGSDIAQAVQAENEGRFKNLQKIGQSNTREAIAEHKKKALAETKQKASIASRLPKP